MIPIVIVRSLDYKLVPWSAPDVNTGRTKLGNRRYRRVKKEPRLVNFQKHIRRCARAAMNAEGKKPATGPIYLDLEFRKRTPHKALWGKFCFIPIGGPTNARGDVTNYVKAVEDGLEKVVFVNDKLVCGGRQMIYWAKQDEVIAKVYELVREPERGFHPKCL
jgi:Holliday junction resolvase RusA-like endonuclease